MRTNVHKSSFSSYAIKVTQPLGAFYAFTIPANILGQITYSQPAEVIARMEKETDSNRGGYSIFGTQRAEKPKRLEEISSFIRTTDATFPNAIILAANYDTNGVYIEEDDSRRWSITTNANGSLILNIPSLQERSASIIDGQHRLHAFDKLPADAPERSMELLCVVFLELPTPYHAYVFATINFNQKKVDRSLAYELFGFDVDERPSQFWSPETLAVYLTRLLNTENNSPLTGCIFPAADSPDLHSLADKDKHQDIRVSMATFVDGILRLISKNPKEDRNQIRRPENKELGRQVLLPIKNIPLRNLYINGNDRAIYDIVCNYFSAVRSNIWKKTETNSYLLKTVGIQAQFDVLKELLCRLDINSTNFSKVALLEKLKKCSNLDPDGNKYQASGIGRSEIRKDLMTALGI